MAGIDGQHGGDARAGELFSTFGNVVEELRGFLRFVAVPLLVVLLFALLAFATYDIDASLSKAALHKSAVLNYLERLFGDRQSTRDLLATLASALITVTSITFSLLLVAVQQSATTFSNQILDQFLHRRTNQFYFGFFIGLSLFTLLELASTKDVHHPLFGALVAIILTIVALILILALIWTTIDQIRSSNVIGNIAAMVRTARGADRPILARTRESRRRSFEHHRPVRHPAAGTVSAVDVACLERLVGKLNERIPCEIVVSAPRGTYVGNGDEIAQLHSAEQLDESDWRDLERGIVDCWSLRSRSSAQDDARAGMFQLSTIGWNSTSSARSNPSPTITICRTVTELLWPEARRPVRRCEESLIVYPDKLPEDGIDTLETITTAAAEARLHHVAAAAYDAYERLLPVLDERLRRRVERAVAASLPALSYHVPTATLEGSLVRLANVLEEIGSPLGATLADLIDRERRTGSFPEDVRVDLCELARVT